MTKSPGKRSNVALDELRRRLSRMGVTQGNNFTPTPRPAKAAKPIEELVEGVIDDTEYGSSFRVVNTYQAAHQHGSATLAEWLNLNPATLASLITETPRYQPEPHRFIFLDTETTGLGSGTANFAFLVGIGYFNDQGDFEIHQFFLRDPEEERAMLALLHNLLQPDTGLVTFNGRGFDVPLLADRYIMSRMKTPISRLPNVDLLHPARRLWKRRLESCRLSALEVDILGLARTHADVSGALIPYLYRDYLRTGNAHEMPRILYHNEQDILSMVSLGVILCRAFDQPTSPDTPIEDRLSLARWYQQRGMLAECETTYRAALDDCPDEQTRYDALTGLAALLKRTNRTAEAVPLWEYVADLKLDTSGHEELAKFYEWQAKDIQSALRWTDAGIALAESWRLGLRRTEALRDLQVRRTRLLRKLPTT